MRKGKVRPNRKNTSIIKTTKTIKDNNTHLYANIFEKLYKRNISQENVNYQSTLRKKLKLNNNHYTNEMCNQKSPTLRYNRLTQF